MTLEVVELGWSTTVQDAGRPGWAAIGVPPSGALDPPLRALLNRLVGNPEDAAVLETAGGLRLRAVAPCVVATAAEAAPRALRPGEALVVGPAGEQLWGYLAVRGGLALGPVLGSMSQDTLSGVGPPALEAGQHLSTGPDPGRPVVVDQAPVDVDAGPVQVWSGPRADWFADGAFETFTATSWQLSSDVSRVGLRLDGPPIERRRTDELPSEGLVTGSIQIPPDGRPIVMLADHPTTGGYPVLAVVDPRSLPGLVQRRPGSEVRFTAARP